MSEEQLKALLAKLVEDAALREQFQSASNLDEIVELARKAGFQISAEGLDQNSLFSNLPIADNELEAVAGGGSALCSYYGDPRCNTNDQCESNAKCSINVAGSCPR